MQSKTTATPMDQWGNHNEDSSHTLDKIRGFSNSIVDFLNLPESTQCVNSVPETLAAAFVTLSGYAAKSGINGGRTLADDRCLARTQAWGTTSSQTALYGGLESCPMPDKPLDDANTQASNRAYSAWVNPVNTAPTTSTRAHSAWVNPVNTAPTTSTQAHSAWVNTVNAAPTTSARAKSTRAKSARAQSAQTKSARAKSAQAKSAKPKLSKTEASDGESRKTERRLCSEQMRRLTEEPLGKAIWEFIRDAEGDKIDCSPLYVHTLNLVYQAAKHAFRCEKGEKLPNLNKCLKRMTRVILSLNKNNMQERPHRNLDKVVKLFAKIIFACSLPDECDEHRDADGRLVVPEGVYFDGHSIKIHIDNDFRDVKVDDSEIAVRDDQGVYKRVWYDRSRKCWFWRAMSGEIIKAELDDVGEKE